MVEVTKQLTAKGRAVVWLRRWPEGEEPETNVTWSMSGEQKAE